MSEVGNILEENERRKAELFKRFDPITGEGSILNRQKLELSDYYLPVQWIPERMFDVALVQELAKSGSIDKYVVEHGVSDEIQRAAIAEEVRQTYTRLRCLYDFAFWCATFVKIAPKEGGEPIYFDLNNPQRKLIEVYESQRLAEQPIRAVIVKARQWGGSTATQIYMAWLQLVHKKGMNSLIIAQVKDTANNIKAMFERLLEEYPMEMLYDQDERVPTKAFESLKFVSMYGSRNVHSIPQRSCNVQIGSAERPETCRGHSHTLLHCSEVASWKRTEGKDPEDLARSAMGGILYKPMTMIVLESTAERTGDYLHGEWQAAQQGKSQYAPVFVSWYEIEQYMLDIQDPQTFAQELWDSRESSKVDSEREQPGKYLWWLWEQGATLEHIAWYKEERKKFTAHEKMAREYPSTAMEAFAHTQASVFSTVQIDKFRAGCRPAEWVGELHGHALEGEDCMEGLHFVEDEYGQLMVWERPEEDHGEEIIANRYITIVDVGRGMSDSADYSDILVLDRLMTMDGGRPVVVAEWHGHIDIDLLAWKAAQIAAWYNNSLLVIESNTVESNGGVGTNMANSSMYVLELIGELYPNLYYREQSAEDIIKSRPRKIGFHTNVKTKREIIEELKRIMRIQGYVERNVEALIEYEIYEQKPNGSYWAPPGTHDDRLMTRAIGLYISKYKMDEVRVVKKITEARIETNVSEAVI